MRITHLITGILVLTGLAVTPVTYAFTGPPQDARPGVEGPRNRPPENRKEMHLDGQPPRERISGEDSMRDRQERNATFTAALKEKGADIRNIFKERREEAVENIKQLRADFKERMAGAREEMKKAIEERRAELKAKLETFKDEKKKQATERLDEAYGNINDRWLTLFTGSVDRIEGVLDAISSRTDKAEAAGKDVAAVRTKIAAASDAITAARNAIEAQASNTYVIDVNSEATVKTDASSMREELKSDLEAVRDAVRAAHEATKEAAKALKDIPGIAEVEVEATTTTN